MTELSEWFLLLYLYYNSSLSLSLSPYIRKIIRFSHLTLYVPCIVTNYINIPTRCTFCMYLFYNLCTNLHVLNDHFVHHQQFMIYFIRSLYKLSKCAQLFGLTVGTDRKSKTFVLFVQSCRYSKSWTPDDEQNGLSKYVDLYINFRINTYRKCILFVSLYV